MGALYRLAIWLYGAAIQLAALRSTKARRWVAGRQNWAERLRQKRAALPAAPLWVHVASLGELEQALPVLDLLRKEQPALPFLISFFSPSGLDYFQSEDPLVQTTYLPLDTPRNARLFVDTLKPRAAWFVKYDVWPFFLKNLSRQAIPTLLAPALFRPGQIYFWPGAGAYFRQALSHFSVVLTQDEGSAERIKPHLYNPVLVGGDPRFDRGAALRESSYKPAFPMAEWQQKERFTLIAGSSWPPEEEMLPAVLDAFPNLELILAPHDLSPAHLQKIETTLGPYGLVRWSSGKAQMAARVLLVDTIGELKYLYRYGQAALIGGGFGKSVHSTIEPMAYGLPLVFGPAHQKFLEPGALIQAGGAQEISNGQALYNWLAPLIKNRADYQSKAAATSGFFARQTGASQSIADILTTLLKQTDKA